MLTKILLLLPLLVSCEISLNTPQVYEPEIITASSQFTEHDLQTEPASNIKTVQKPHFDFLAYQKRGQIDPQKYRYIQQQKRDQLHANEQYHANYRQARNEQQLQPSQESPVRVPAPVGHTWKLIHPKFVTENVKDLVTVTGVPTTMMEYQNTRGIQQQNLLEREQNMKKTGAYDKITPTMATDDVNRKGRIYKKSLQPASSYQLEDVQPVEERQDVGSLGAYVGYLNPDLNQEGKRDQLSALTSLLGKHPNVQLQGLNQLLANARPVYNKDHIPIHEHQQEQTRNNQNYPTRNNNVLENAIIAQTQAITHQVSSPESLSNLQAQLDATAKLHADKIIAQAQQKAVEHVQAQHKAIALAQVQAEKVALAQVQAQNEALQRAHADAQTKAEHDEKKNKDTARLRKLAAERKRFQEQIRLQAVQRKLLREREQQALTPQPKAEAHDVAQKTRQKTLGKISHAESQNQYYHHQALSYASPYQQSIPHTVTLNVPKSPVKYISTKLHAIQTPAESFIDVHSAGYNQHTKSDEADVTKYFVPPQITVQEYKNAKGEHDLLYAAKYAFGYRIRDYHNGNDFGHEEANDGGHTKGHYHVLLPDGRVQNVHYVADDDGFHAKVSYGNVILSSVEDDASK